MLTQNEKLRGGLYGLLIGDAVGVPYEFKTPNQLPAYDQIDMQPPVGFQKTYPEIPIGTWSDDGAQALCLLASLLKCQKLDQREFAIRLQAWYRSGYMAVDRKVFDIGVQTQQALDRLTQNFTFENMANADEDANGNGSLMRCLPLVLWHHGNNKQLIEDAFAQSHLTHAHLRSKLCCAFYCLWAKQLLEDVELNQAWDQSVLRLKQYFEHDQAAMHEIEHHIFSENNVKVTGTGYVVDSLHSAKFALQQSTFKDVIKTAISLGNDTDTTACIAGGLAGIIFGLSAIPEDWVWKLRGKEILEPVKEDLMRHWNLAS